MTITKADSQQMVGANFVSVGQDAIDLQDIKLVGDDGSEGGSYIKWWDPATATYSTEVQYLNPLYNPDDTPMDHGGWGDGETW